MKIDSLQTILGILASFISILVIIGKPLYFVYKQTLLQDSQISELTASIKLLQKACEIQLQEITVLKEKSKATLVHKDIQELCEELSELKGSVKAMNQTMQLVTKRLMHES